MKQKKNLDMTYEKLSEKYEVRPLPPSLLPSLPPSLPPWNTELQHYVTKRAELI